MCDAAWCLKIKKSSSKDLINCSIFKSSSKDVINCSIFKN